MRSLHLGAAVLLTVVLGCDRGTAPASPVAPVESVPPAQPPGEAPVECEDAQSCVDLAFHYFEGTGGKPKDHAAFLSAVDKACEFGAGSACLTVAVLHWGSGYPQGLEAYEGPQDQGLYSRYLERACMASVPAAHGCNILGVMHARGEAGASRDIPKAAQWFGRGCALELPTSCFELGLLYETEPDAGGTLEQARELYERACTMRDPKACNNLGFMYESGGGVPRDKAKAVQYYEQACALGFEAGYCAPQ